MNWIVAALLAGTGVDLLFDSEKVALIFALGFVIVTSICAYSL